MTRTAAAFLAASFWFASPGFAAAPVLVPAAKDRVKQLHDSKIKTGLGLPTFTFGRGYSTLSTRWTPAFRVSPPVDEWVTDWDEDRKDSVYQVKLSLVRFPDGSKRSLYTAAQKAELWKNMLGHLYKLTGKRLEQALALPANKALFAKFAAGIDGPGFDFPAKIQAPR